jgi:drug/metabolite transporter (DMT)-like permease
MSQINQKTDTRLAWVAFALLSVIWGTTYPTIKIAVEEMPAFLLSGLRHIIAGALMLGYFVFKGFSKSTLKDHLRIAAASIFMIVGGNGLVCLAEQSIPSGLTAIISSIYPLVTVMLGIILLKQKVNTTIMIGMLLGIVGIILIFADSLSGLVSKEYILGNVMVLLAVASWSFGSLFLKKNPVSIPTTEAIAWQIMYGGILNMLIYYSFGGDQNWNFSPKVWWSVGYLALFGSIIGYICFYYAIEKLPVAQVSTYSYINTVISVFIGVFFLREVLPWVSYPAMLLTIIGAIIANWGFSKLKNA